MNLTTTEEFLEDIKFELLRNSRCDPTILSKIDKINTKKTKNEAYQQCQSFITSNILDNIARRHNAIIPPIQRDTIRVDQPYDNVLEFAKRQPFFYDESQAFWVWNYELNCWKVQDETNILNLLETTLSFRGDTIKASVKQAYLESLKRVGRASSPLPLPPSWVQFKNCFFDVRENKQHAITSMYFCRNPIPWELSDDCSTPYLDKLFTEWCGPEGQKSLFEVIAFCMVPEYFIQRIIAFVGSGSNGKSKYLEFLRLFLGSSNISTTSLDMLSENPRFETLQLYGKLATLMGETNFTTIKRTELIKRLRSGSDPIRAERKGGAHFDFISYAKLLVATNTLPETTDTTQGYYRSWFIIKFPNTFTEARDVLADIPLKEYDNLCRKCINLLVGSEGLYKRHTFSHEGTINDRRIAYEKESNPLKRFIDETYDRVQSAYVFKFEFKKDFDAFCSRNGYRVWSDREVGLRLHADGLEEGQENYELINDSGINKRYRVWYGLRRKPVPQEVLHSLNNLNTIFLSVEQNASRRESPVQAVQAVQMPTFDELRSLIKSQGVDGKIPYDHIWRLLGSPDSAMLDKLVKSWCDVGLVYFPRPGVIGLL